MELNRQCPISLPLPAVGAPPQTPCSLRSHCEKNNDADAIIWRSIICLSTECVHRKHCFHNFFFDHSLDIVHAHHTDLVVVRGEIQKSSAKSLGFIYKSLCTNFGSIASGYYSGLVERLRMSTREGQVCPTFFTRQSRLFSIFKSSQSDFLKKQVHWIICKMARRFIKFGILPERTTDVLVTHSMTCGMHSDRNGSLPNL